MSDDHQAAVALADAIEAAPGPSREIDGAIWCALNGERPYELVGGGTGWDGAGQCYYARGGVGHIAADRVRRYTESVDAALTMLNGAGVLLHLGDITGDGLPWAHVGNPVQGGGEGKATGRTLPLALCAAALRCRSASR